MVAKSLCETKICISKTENNGVTKTRQTTQSLRENTLFGFYKTYSQNGFNKAIKIGHISSENKYKITFVTPV